MAFLSLFLSLSLTHTYTLMHTLTCVLLGDWGDRAALGLGFELSVRLTEMRAPRLWIEEDDHGHRALMLSLFTSFQPQGARTHTHRGCVHTHTHTLSCTHTHKYAWVTM
jgi:hypothetical protein